MGWFATNALRESRLLRRFLSLPTYLAGSDGGIDGIVDAAGNTIDFGTPVYTFGTQPNPYAVPKYTEILIDPACLTGSGATTQGIKLRSDLVNWCFADRGQMIYANSGSVASPLTSGIAGAGATEISLLGSLNQPMLPAFLLYKGCRGRFRCKIKKSGGNGNFDVIVRLGTHVAATDIDANDALLNFPGVALTDQRTFWVSVEFCVIQAGIDGNTAGSTGTTKAILTTTNFLTENASAVSAIADRSTLFSTTDPIYFNINTKNANASDTFALIEYSLELLP